MELSREQVREFDEHGFLFVPGLLSEEEMGVVRASAFKLSAPERVGLADLEKLHARCQQRLEQLERDDR